MEIGGSSSDGSIGMKDANGVPARVFPAGTNVNTIAPDMSNLIDNIYVGDDLYMWTGSDWMKMDTSVPPDQSTIVEGQIGQEMSPFN